MTTMEVRRLKSSDRNQQITVVDDRWPEQQITGIYQGRNPGQRPHHVTIQTASGKVWLTTRHTLRIA